MGIHRWYASLSLSVAHGSVRSIDPLPPGWLWAQRSSSSNRYAGASPNAVDARKDFSHIASLFLASPDFSYWASRASMTASLRGSAAWRFSSSSTDICDGSGEAAWGAGEGAVD